MTGILEPNCNGDLQHGLIGGPQQPRGFESQGRDELMRRFTGLAAEYRPRE
jgi:hypothetical protein